ncbi:LacI family DNA-binding transcriptional regulator [Defluviimonas aestuarii]|uniref:LacI family DNA-binding transcriptional regulator n=1 Tax=Albidovulum aestuarii TaxID=1130726 RepID=UPI00249A2EBB|nr:LacI family DNA-binding transcriptional regulator [Defluviimonas aestuarii]MDI3336831.1 LacI family DNA-binding transcriptional regulator [Defluviimonas aestuarii]
MAGRMTIADVAREAGVSTATVDRVLNGREKVRESTAKQVFEAAHRIGYHAAGLIGQRIKTELPLMRFGFVMHKEKQAFYKNFAAEMERAVRAAPDVRGELIIEYSASQSPGDFADLMRGLKGRVDVMGATAVTHHIVTEAVQELQEGGIPCFALLNDFAQGVRQNYIGLNNLKVGRIAASMIATAVHKPGKIAVFVGGYRWHGHELRETGFRSYFREYAPQFTVLDTLVNLETRQLTYEATLDLLARHPDLRGIYCAGGGMEGAIAALREVRQPGDVALVVNEVTPETRAGLQDRYITLVISTPLAVLCRDVVALMSNAVLNGMSDVVGQHFLQPELYLAESI